jgi:glycosyltransferase involved in cell wall biosynthesis
MKRLHGQADHVIYQSHFCKLSSDRFLGTHPSRYSILHNPVDTTFFCPTAKEGKEEEKITLLLAGSHWSPYRPKTAIEVVHRVSAVGKNIYLKIAGPFCWEKNHVRGEKEMKVFAEQLGVADRVTFTGPYTQHNASELFRSCSILLHTKYNDPCPRLVVEAMACGLPVVYSATGGVPELVDERSGVGVEGPLDWNQDHPPDADALADAVLAVISNLDGYAQGARETAVEKFDVKPWLKKHREIFMSLLDK